MQQGVTSPAAKCSGKIWLAAAFCSREVWLPSASCSGELNFNCNKSTNLKPTVELKDMNQGPMWIILILRNGGGKSRANVHLERVFRWRNSIYIFFLTEQKRAKANTIGDIWQFRDVWKFTVGAVFRVAAIIRVAAVFGALKIIFSELFFLHDNLQIRKNQNKQKNVEIFFCVCPFFSSKSKPPFFVNWPPWRPWLT
jgi:hypothetical protein